MAGRRAGSATISPSGGPSAFACLTPRSIPLIALVLALAFAASGCGDDEETSAESLPPRPALTVPDDSVESEKSDDDEGSTDATGETGTDTSTGTNTGGAGTGTDTGGAGTGTGTGTGGGGTNGGGNTTPQDTGGAAPGN